MRYFFHVWTGDDCARDTEGLELGNDDEAARCAVTSAREILEEDIRNGRVSSEHRFEVEDGAGRRVATLPFSLIVTGLPDEPSLRTTN